jgi:SAM-dependent methyltransferase
MTCELCSTNEQSPLDDVYTQCFNCKGIIRKFEYRLSQTEEKSRYLEHNNDVLDIRYQNFTAPVTRYILSNYDTKHQGLDYGCGPGPVIAHVLKQNGFNPVLFDPYFKLDKSYSSLLFDYIYSCEVFEHFWHPAREIEHLLSLLKPKGRLIIHTALYRNHTPFKGWNYKKDPTHVFIYTPETITFIAKLFNLKIAYWRQSLIVYEIQQKYSAWP